jgi:hypothetical protein
VDKTKIKVSKIDAARRQLDTAIELWFYDKDPVSVHALARAAYEIIHDINQKKGGGVDLLFDSVVIKDEYQKEWAAVLKAPGNFFKHADRDPEDIVEFPLEGSLLFFIFAIRGLHNLGERRSARAEVFLKWIEVNRPEWVIAEFRERLVNALTVEGLKQLRAVPKNEYFEQTLQLVLATGRF